MKVSVLNIGCKVNQAESAEIEAHLRASGCSIAELSEKPDLCIINTCSVTAKSDYQSRQLIRRAHRAGAMVIVTGCYSELNRDSVVSMPGVTKVVMNSAKSGIVDEIMNHGSSSLSDPSIGGKSRFFLKVQDGCNFSCSYCIIPKARGISRSIGIDCIVKRVEDLASRYHEVVLTGIHLGTYGYDLVPHVSLADLLRALLRTQIGRIRLSSLEINEIHDDLLELLAEERVCSHLHVPLQSGDDTILALMNRTYDVARFAAGIHEVEKRVPGIAIGTDVIAGFPGEDHAAFQRTYRLIESLPFSYIHVFPFSQRPGTRASTMSPLVAQGVKKERCASLTELGGRKKRAFMESQVGKILDPLMEERCQDGYFLGTSGNYLKVKAPVVGQVVKKIVGVRITSLADHVLIGVPINNS